MSHRATDDVTFSMFSNAESSRIDKAIGYNMYLYIMLLHNEDETLAGC